MKAPPAPAMYYAPGWTGVDIYAVIVGADGLSGEHKATGKRISYKASARRWEARFGRRSDKRLDIVMDRSTQDLPTKQVLFTCHSSTRMLNCLHFEATLTVTNISSCCWLDDEAAAGTACRKGLMARPPRRSQMQQSASPSQRLGMSCCSTSEHMTRPS